MTFCLAVQSPISRDKMKGLVARRFGSTVLYDGRDVPNNLTVTMEDIFFERMFVQLKALGYIQEEKNGLFSMTAAAREHYTSAMVYKKQS